MKTKIILSTLALMLALPAEAREAPVLVQERTETIEIDLTKDTVKCLVGDYGAMSLKVLIPELANLTILNHRVPGSNAPCVTAGLCKTDLIEDGLKIEDIVDEKHPKEKVGVEVSLYRSALWNETTQVCNLTMMEEVKTKIRGIEFTHFREIPIEENSGWNSSSRPKEDCI